MADTKISALPAATTPLAGTEVLPIVQDGVTEKVAVNDLTVRNIRANATTGILQITGPANASTRIATVPDANFTVARTDAAQSFTGNQTLSTGNLIIGTSGKGIDFSATPGTGTSELLADYEEGTWTPSFSKSGGSTPSQTSTGTYTQIGNVVYFSFVCTFAAPQDEGAYYNTDFVFQSGTTSLNAGSASVQGTSTQYAIEGISLSRLRVYITASAVNAFTGFGMMRI
jgi:hypothetical protein